MYDMVSGLTNSKAIDVDGDEETQEGDFHSVT